MNVALKSKTQFERELLHSLAIACYGAGSGDLMKSPAVKRKVADIEKHVADGLYSAKFDNTFIQITGNINANFSMRIDCHGKATVFNKNRPANNVTHIGVNHA